MFACERETHSHIYIYIYFFLRPIFINFNRTFNMNSEMLLLTKRYKNFSSLTVCKIITFFRKNRKIGIFGKCGSIFEIIKFTKYGALTY